MIRPLAILASPLVFLGLAGCEPVPASNPRPGVVSVPQSVASIAAPYQDVTTARLKPEDGCFWYLHQGPVETTELPLRTADGSPICTRPQG
ncbi:MAG: hypothetical protein KDK26_09025 [Roseivivax sp.]|nr:hypothetical protein [Roseivivax sp.]